jgi:hypothetical protein
MVKCVSVLAMWRFYPGGWKPPSTAGRDARRYIALGAVEQF